ncbi:MAG: hypothetical protein IPJ66_10905 [Bacteroidetes bacterium]|nr:hypothetical protein [Bacteroidota bacterium]
MSDTIAKPIREELYNWAIGYIKTNPLKQEIINTANAKVKLGELVLLKTSCTLHNDKLGGKSNCTSKKNANHETLDKIGQLEIKNVYTTMKDGYIYDIKIFAKDGRSLII